MRTFNILFCLAGASAAPNLIKAKYKLIRIRVRLIIKIFSTDLSSQLIVYVFPFSIFFFCRCNVNVNVMKILNFCADITGGHYADDERGAPSICSEALVVIPLALFALYRYFYNITLSHAQYALFKWKRASACADNRPKIAK